MALTAACAYVNGLPRRMKGEEGDRVRKNPLGLGLLLGGAVFAYGLSSGCSKAEILAINDDGEHSSSRCLRVPAAG